MRRIINYIVTLGIIASITISNSIITMAQTEKVALNSQEVVIIPNAAATSHAFKKGGVLRSTLYGTATVKYIFSGNYTYHLSSGEILSAYDARLDEFSFYPPPASSNAPNPDFWEYEALNIRLTQSVIDKGARAKYTVSFTLKATYLEGGAIATNKTISIPVTDTLYVDAH
jgi:hypothetical protein